MKLLSAWGPGGIAVVLAAPGAEAARLRSSLQTRDGRPALVLPGGPPVRCVLRAADEVLDEVLALDRGAGGIEVHLHGSPAVLDALAAVLGPFAGEPVDDPAEQLLRDALGEEQLALALEQRSLDWNRFLEGLRALPADRCRREAAAARRRSRAALALANSRRLVLAGAQNAGKSTLMNRLLLRERALAGPLPGLTRDPVREHACLSGYPYEIVDTAGEGEAGTAADRSAVASARAARAGALVVLVVDGSRGPGDVDRALAGPARLVLRTKTDLPQAAWPAGFPLHLSLSCLDPAAAPAVRAAVGEALRMLRRLPPAGPVGGPAALTRSRLAALRALA